jgi:AcrR family transcriptional regulator
MVFSETAHGVPPEWEARALRRSLSAAQTRSLGRIHRLVGAARELADETGSAGFTVAQVCSRADISLKGFYHCFAGKDELLLALVEEDTRTGAALLIAEIERHAQPERRVRAYIAGIFGMLTLPGAVGYAGVLWREYRRLSEDHPDALRAAVAPLVDLLRDELAAAVATGDAAVSDPPRAAQAVFGLILAGISDVTTGAVAAEEQAEWLWQLCWTGLRGEKQR